MEQRILAPRRILTFLVLTAVVAVSAVAAAGFGAVDSGLPDEFHPAQPLPGDKAEYSMSLVHPDGAVSVNALPSLRVESGHHQWVWDSTGTPRLVVATITQTADVWTHDPQGTDPVELSWGDRLSFARGAGRTIYYEQAGGQSFDFRGGYQGLLQGETNYTSTQKVRQYLAGGDLLVNCLTRTLPPSFEVAESVPLGPCIASHARLDPDQPLPSGREFHARGPQVSGTYTDIRLRAIGQASTEFGSALVLDDGRDGGGLRVWFMESVPYPVQILVAHGDGNLTLHRLVSFQRGQPADPPAGAPPPLPQVRWSTAMAWGPSDLGVDLAFKPSAAWQLALDDSDGRLRSFLAAHPNAYTEFAEGGHDVRRQGDSWRFQLRDGTARLAMEVVRGPPDLMDELDLDLPVPSQVTVREVAVEQVFSAQEAPATIPDLRSAAVRFQEITGEAPNGFTYTWSAGCPGGTLSTCSAPVVVAWREVASSSAVPQLSGTTLQSNRDWARVELASWGDGRLAALRTSSSSTLHREALLPFAAAPAATEPSVAAPWSVPSPSTLAGIGAAAGLLGLLYLFWPAIKGPVLGLFSRTTNEEVLEQPGRRRVHEAIVAQPGIHVQALVRVTGLGKGTVEHHLRKLVAAGRVVVNEGTGYTSHFPAGTDHRVVGTGPVLRAASARAILQAILANPGTNGGQVAQQLALNRGTVLHHIKRLKATGLITNQNRHGISQLYPTKLASMAMAF